MDSLRWRQQHGNRAEIAGWSFTEPRSWYMDSFKDDVYLSRVSFFDGETVSSIYVSPTPGLGLRHTGPMNGRAQSRKNWQVEVAR